MAIQNEHDVHECLTRFQELFQQGNFAEADRVLNDVIESKAIQMDAYSRERLGGYRGIGLVRLRRFHEAADVLEPALAAQRQRGIRDADTMQQLRFLGLAQRELGHPEPALTLLKEARELARELADETNGKAIDADLANTTAIRDNKGVIEFTPFSIGSQRVGGVDITIPKRALDIAVLLNEIAFTPLDSFRAELRLAFRLANRESIMEWDPSNSDVLTNRPILFALLLPHRAQVRPGSFTIDINDSSESWKSRYFFAHSHLYTFFHPTSYPSNGNFPMPLNAAHRFIQSNALVFRSRLPKRAAIRFEGTIEFPADDADGISNERDLSVHALIPYGLATTVPARFESRRLDGFDLHGEQMGISLFLQRRNPTPFVDDRQDGSLALRVSVLPPAEPAIGPTGWMPREQWESERPVLGECPILGVKATLRATRSTTAAVQSMRDILPTGTYEYITRTDRVNKDGKSLNLLDMPTDPLPAFTCILENHDESETNLVIRTTCDDLGISESHNVVVPPRSRRVVEVTPVMPETPPIFQRFIDGPDEDLGIATVEVQTQIYPKDQNERAGLSPHSERRTVLNALPPDYIVWAVTNHKDGSVIGLHHHIARWVTPDEPVLDPLLKEWGCPTGDRTEDLRRIYDGLLPMNFAYDLDRVNTGAEMDHDYQRVRLPRVSLRHRRINCIDGTVLIASLLERLGHSPIILLLPGHAFLGLVTRGKTDAVKSMHFIETTGLCRRWQIGSNSVSIATDPRAGTTLTSTHAATVGLAQFKKAEFDFMGERTTKLNRKESDPKAISPSKPRAPGHHIVTLEAARKRGIMPFAPQA